MILKVEKWKNNKHTTMIFFHYRFYPNFLHKFAKVSGEHNAVRAKQSNHSLKVKSNSMNLSLSGIANKKNYFQNNKITV